MCVCVCVVSLVVSCRDIKLIAKGSRPGGDVGKLLDERRRNEGGVDRVGVVLGQELVHLFLEHRTLGRQHLAVLRVNSL